MNDKQEHKPFWMVWNPRGRAPVVRHPDEQVARQEVERLVRLEGGPIYLLQAVAEAHRADPPVKWEELSAAPESPDDNRKDHVGILAVETDWDFGMVIAGQTYADSEFSVVIHHLDELREATLLGPFGSPEGGKTEEIEEALQRILTRPEEPFSTLGGNRGARWTPAAAQSVPMYGPPPRHLQLEQQNHQLMLERTRLEERLADLI